MFPKPMRKQNRKLLDTYHEMRCLACYATPCDPAHIRTRARGGGDYDWNVIPLCRKHHIEQGQIGWDPMRRKYPRVDDRLHNLGWEKLNGRLWHPKLGVDDDTENL